MGLMKFENAPWPSYSSCTSFDQSCCLIVHAVGRLMGARMWRSGLMGGHSGLNINEDRGNAVRFAARIADTLLEAAPGARLVQISGGDKRNAIPREATAILLVGCHTSPSVLFHSAYKCRSDPGKSSEMTFHPCRHHAPV